MWLMLIIMMTISNEMLVISGMWLMLQQDKPDDFVLATGHMHSVREFVEVILLFINLIMHSVTVIKMTIILIVKIIIIID